MTVDLNDLNSDKAMAHRTVQISKDLKLTVSSYRWNDKDQIRFKLTKTGWKDGKPKDTVLTLTVQELQDLNNTIFNQSEKIQWLINFAAAGLEKDYLVTPWNKVEYVGEEEETPEPESKPEPKTKTEGTVGFTVPSTTKTKKESKPEPVKDATETLDEAYSF